MTDKVLIKLTDENMRTYCGCQWALNEEKTADGLGRLCSEHWLHCYEADSIEAGLAFALMLNPIHAGFVHPRAFVATGTVGLRDGALKCGVTSLTLSRELELPRITLSMRVRFAIYCAQAYEIGLPCAWSEWAKSWLSGLDRTVKSAESAARAAEWAAKLAADSVANSADISNLALRAIVDELALTEVR